MVIMMMGRQTLLDHGRRVMVAVQGSNFPTHLYVKTRPAIQWTVEGHHDNG